VAVPLMDRNIVLGAISVYSATANAFDDEALSIGARQLRWPVSDN
jgi:hypothetical protein